MVILSPTDHLTENIKNSIPALVEVPTVWLKSKKDGDRNRLMFDQLKNSLSRHQLDVTFKPIPFGESFKVRNAPNGGFTLSYHSIGNTPNVWRIKETPVQYFYSFDRFGFSGWSDLALRPAHHKQLIANLNALEADAFTGGLRTELIESNSSKYKQPEDEPFSIEEPFIFYPLQMRNDLVARLNRIDPIDVLYEAARLAKKHRIKLVVKRHPYCHNPYVSLALWKAKLNNPYLIRTSASIHKILPACSKVLVANSGVGFEALIHRKQVFSFGESEYELATHSLHSLDQMEQVFCDHHPIDTTWINRFVYYFLKQSCFDARNAREIDLKLKLAIDCIQANDWPEAEKFFKSNKSPRRAY